MFAAAKSLLTRRQGGVVSAFVTRDPATGNLMLGGARIRFAGANCANDVGHVSSANNNAYGGTVHGDHYLTTHSQADALLASAQAMKLNLLKCESATHSVNDAEAIQPTLGVFNAASLEPVDYFLQQCASTGIKVVLPLAEEYDSKPWYVTQTGGGSNDNFYTRTTPAPGYSVSTVDAFKNHISFVLDHVNPYTGLALKDDPTILCWQIGNEFTTSAITEAQYTAWADDIVNHIKVVKGAKQLVQDGHYGPKGLTSGCDIMDQHAYDQWRTPAFLIGQAQTCHAAGKAYFVGEFDWDQGSLTKGAWTLDQQLDAWERSQYMDGSSFWDLLAPLTTWGDGYTLHYPGTNADMITRGDMLSDHAQRMAGITPKTFLSDSFTGANGALLSGHVGEVGAAWNQQATSWTGVPTIQNNRIWASTEAHYYSSGVPASGDYTVSADVFVVSLLGVAGVAARSTTEDTHSYVGYVTYSGGTTTCSIIRHGGAVNLGSATVTTPAVGSTHTIKLKVQGSAISLYWDNTLVVGPITDATYAAAGRAGVRLGGSATATKGFHLENITATDL